MGIKKPGIIAAVVAAVIVVGGGVATAATLANTTPPDGRTSTAEAVAMETPAASATDAPATDTPATDSPDLASKTQPGEVCDPHNLNDTICAAFYPDLAVLNMTLAPRAGEPLASLPDDQRIALAHQACDQMDAGADQKSVNVIETSAADIATAHDNNRTLASAGALAYCNDHITKDGFGTKVLWTLNAYRDMGEKAAKESFAGGHVIQP